MTTLLGMSERNFALTLERIEEIEFVAGQSGQGGFGLLTRALCLVARGLYDVQNDVESAADAGHAVARELESVARELESRSGR